MHRRTAEQMCACLWQSQRGCGECYCRLSHVTGHPQVDEGLFGPDGVVAVIQKGVIVVDMGW
jgi:hypothetical protein